MAELRAFLRRLVGGLEPDEDAGLDSTYGRVDRRLHRRRITVAALALIIAASGFGVGAVSILRAKREPSAVRATNGVIAFEVDVIQAGTSPTSAIYVVNPDGTGLHRLTNSSVFGDPAWSPDGTTVAVDVQDSTRGGIYLLDANGTNVRQITQCGSLNCLDVGPTWSPDGRQLAFQRRGATGAPLVVVNADGSNPRSLPCPPTLCPFTPPKWSPDGQWLVFAQCCEQGIAPREVPFYEMHPDGTGLHRLVRSVCPPQCYTDGSPAWSPNGRELAFVRWTQGSSNVFAMSSSGTDVRQLTHCDAVPCAMVESPVWSPDGRRIAFVRDRSNPGHINATLEVMNADGSGVQVVTSLPGQLVCCPSWSRRAAAPPPTPSTHAPSSPIPPSTCTGMWRPVVIPGATNDGFLVGVSAVAADDVWAVGGTGTNGDGSSKQTLALHWDGARWTEVPMPSPGLERNELAGVDALASNDAWAVGFQSAIGQGPRTLTLHWDGSAWTTIPSPSPATSAGYLNAVKVISADDVWAVGDSGNENAGKGVPLIEHWDGQRWTIEPTPDLMQKGLELGGVAGDSTSDVWAVGSDNTTGKNDALTLHWDGAAWRRVPVPTGSGVLNAVAVIAPDDVWAAGVNALHWEGRGWTVSSLQPPKGLLWSLNALAVIGPRDLWAAGEVYGGQTEGSQSPVYAHWDGTKWKVTIGPPTPATWLISATALPSGEAWVVGRQSGAGPISQRRCDP